MVARWSRIGALVAVWLFVVAVLGQVFLAGLALFADERWALHVEVGWILHLAPLLVLLLVALSRPPRSVLLLAVALAVVMFIQPILATLRAEAPVVAALHPVFALLVFSLGLTLALRLTALARASAPPADTSRPVAAL